MPWNRRKTDKILTEATVVMVASIATMRRAERAISACQRCDRAAADTPFSRVLTRTTTEPLKPIEYLMPEPAHCPRCDRPILEDTLVEIA